MLDCGNRMTTVLISLLAVFRDIQAKVKQGSVIKLAILNDLNSFSFHCLCLYFLV